MPAKERLKKYGNIIACYGESLAFQVEDAKEVLLQLLIDDGSKTKGQRNNIFKSEFNVMGCYTGPHADFYNCVCLDYAGGFTESDADDPIEAFMAQFLKEEVDFQMP